MKFNHRKETSDGRGNHGSSIMAGRSVSAQANQASQQRKQRLRGALGLSLGLSLGCLSGATLHAQDAGLSVQRFNPAPGGALNYNHVEGAGIEGSLRPTFGLFVNYAHRPLVATNGTTTNNLLEYDAAVDLSVGIGLGKRFQLGLVVPATFAQLAGDIGTLPLDPIASTALGDIRVVPKALLVDSDAFSLALSVPIGLPTGSPANYHGHGGVSFEPRVIAELKLSEALRLGANLGYAIQPSQTLLNLTTGNEFRYGVGAAYALMPDRLTLLAEAFGGVSQLASNGYGVIRSLPMEANLAGRLQLGTHSLTLGAGPGLTITYGTPLFRAFLGYAFNAPAAAPPPPDTDGDGLIDTADQCPKEAEDADRFQDEDGCPDPDNDKDTILDTADKCPNDPEDKDNFEDADGCPDPDNDKDGVKDADDKCPTELEDKDNFQDTDGCPDPDNDQDKILDVNDKCPDQPEDYDKLGDEDGCPETDHDSDGILDEVDQCPRKPETINGNKDDDGCPDEGKSKVNVTGSKIEILDKVYFATNKSDILPKSFPVLKQVIAVLKANPQITRLSIDGHTDDRSSDEYNQKLSQARVDSVQAYLIQGGIDANRLKAVGYGESKPLVPNTSDANRSKNRRVEFTIVEIDGKPVQASTSIETPAPAPK